MAAQSRVTIVLGTRPEAIKLAPVIQKFRNCKLVMTRVVLTGQHSEMVHQVMELFNLTADRDLGLMTPQQTLTQVTCAVLQGLRNDFQEYQPQLVLVQGDTTTAFTAALAAFYEQIPVGHVEAGLRTGNLLDPFPEEVNRRLISQIAQLHFAPTLRSKINLQQSGVMGRVLVTGNTVIDALLHIAEKTPSLEDLPLDFRSQKVILATVHRRENWGNRLDQITAGMLKVLKQHADIAILLPLHRNPTVREPLQKALGDHPRVVLTESLSYDRLVAAMRSCTLLLTDSGGLQEEAPAFGKPVLVLRRTTERPEAVDAGTVRLVGTDPDVIAFEAKRLLQDSNAYDVMAHAANPFGDGHASGKILVESISMLSPRTK